MVAEAVAVTKSREQKDTDWCEVQLGRLLTSSPRYGINAAAVADDGTRPPYLRITDIRADGRLSTEGRKAVDHPDADQYTLDAGDIVVARTGASVGKSFLVRREDLPLVYAGFLIRLQTNPKELLSEFLAQYLRTKSYWNWIAENSARSGQPGVNGNQLRLLPIKLPRSIDEQRAIARALSDADALIESLEQLIEKKRRIKEGAMQELLTGKRRLPGFEGEWGTVTLGSVAHVKTGARNNQDKVPDGEYPFFVRSENVERIDEYSHDCEAILVPGEGGIGSIFHYIRGKFNVHQRVYAITQFDDAVVSRFVFYQMRASFGQHAMENSVKATVDSLRLPTFLEFQCQVPTDRGEQEEIAALLDSMETELETLELQLVKTRQVKEGMMQELLTGRIRLV